LADFGMAGTSVNGGRRIFSTYQGTACYMSPERIKGEEHSFDSDIWSLGLSVAELALGKLPQISNIWDLMIEKSEEATRCFDFGVDLPEQDYSQELRDFVEACMKVNPNDRAKATELLEHAFIKKYKQDGATGSDNINIWLKLFRKKKKKKSSEKKKKPKETGPVIMSTNRNKIIDYNN
jgi:serine/threonine protein kinase